MNFAAQFIIFSIIIHHIMDYLAEFFVHSGFSLTSHQFLLNHKNLDGIWMQANSVLLSGYGENLD